MPEEFEWIVIGRAFLLSVSREEPSRWDLLYITNMAIKRTYSIVHSTTVGKPKLGELNMSTSNSMMALEFASYHGSVIKL